MTGTNRRSSDAVTVRRAHSTPLVSVIVPIYNVEQYLQPCLDSLAAQSLFPRLEVLLIDDGSTDGSAVIAKAFEQEHANVRLLSQPNSGPGAARNNGLRHASGEFISFLDSDDLLPPDALLRLLSRTDGTVDVAVGRMRTFPMATNWPWTVELKTARVIDSIDYAPALIHGAGPCNKLFRTSFIRKHGLTFAEEGHFEDVFFTLPALLKARRIALVDALVYEYRKRDLGGSIMDSVFTLPSNYWDHLRVEEFLLQQRSGLTPGAQSAVNQFIVRSFQGFALRAPEHLPPGDLRPFFDRCSKVFRQIPIDVISQTALDARHKIAFAAFIADDFDLFADRPGSVGRLTADGGVLRILRDLPSAVDELVTMDRISAHIESIHMDPVTKHAVVRGRFALGGVPLRRPLGARLALRVRGSGVTVRARNVARPEFAERAPDQLYSGFEARVPVKRLRTGQHHMRLVFMTPEGQASTRTRPSQGYLRSARALAQADLRVIPRVDRWDSCQLLVARGRGATSKFFWHLKLLFEDIDHATNKQPLWQMRVLRLVTRPFFRRRDVWLMAERRDTAQDNSAVLFEHLRKKHPEKQVYYVMDKAAPPAARMRALGHVVNHSSFTHRLLMLHARVLIASYDIDGYLLPDSWKRDEYQRHLAWRIGSRRVFLQHGVIYNDVSAALHKGITGLDLFVTSSLAEARFVKQRMGYGKEVRVLGLPRFDTLSRKKPGKTRILFMPTWRVYLVSPSYAPDRSAKVPLMGSTYQLFISELLNSPRLRDALIAHDAELEFLPHYEMSQVAQQMFEPHPSIVLSHHHQRDIQTALRECDVFMTDWSSTFFDVAYLGTPTVLMPFDQDEFRAGHYRAGYFDFERDAFGPVAYTAKDAVEECIRYLENGQAREDVYDARAARFFGHRDAENCERVIRSIERVAAGR
jgi:CDP-glycerol glycerophosphotransferase (TagB/SpsB family)